MTHRDIEQAAVLEGVQLFRHRDESFLFDCSTLRVARLSPAAERLLTDRWEESNSGDARAAEELRLLRRAGMFTRRAQRPPLSKSVNRLARMHSPKVTLALARACNQRCRYCYEASARGNDVPPLMPRRVAHRALEMFGRPSEDGCPTSIVFFGGEPLLNTRLLLDVVDRTQRARPGNMFYSLTTGAVFMPQSVLRVIKRHNFGLKISIDGGPEVQNRQRPLVSGQPSHRRVARSVAAIKRVRSQLSARATLTRDCIEPVRLAGEIARLGFTKIGFGVASGRSFEKGPLDLRGHDFDKLLEQYELALDISLEALEMTGRPPVWFPFATAVSKFCDPSSVSQGIRCGFARGVSTVDTDGTIYPCHRFIGMQNYRIGSVDTGFDEDRKRAILFDYAATVDSHCNDCWAFPVCRGPCPWLVARPDGTFDRPDTDGCRVTRSFSKLSLVAYWKISTRFPEYVEQLMNRRRAQHQRGDGR